MRERAALSDSATGGRAPPRCDDLAWRAARQSRSPSSARSWATSGRGATVTVPLVAGDELLGVLTAEGTSEVDLARAVANQTAVTIKDRADPAAH